MKKLYFIFSTHYGEVEGVFDADLNLLDWWSSNDAHWRSEYFAGLLEHLGVEEATPTDAQEDLMVAKLDAVAKELGGFEDEEEDDI